MTVNLYFYIGYIKSTYGGYMTIIAIPTNNSDEFSEVPKRAQNAAYVKYAQACGFTPILVPMEADPDEIADIADVLLLAGGIDVDPMYYGMPNNGSVYTNPDKDASERNLLHAFRLRGKKTFAICRGMQLVFREYVHMLGDVEEAAFFDYIENIGGHGQTSMLHARRSIPSHYVKADMSALFNSPMKPRYQMLPVNSMHHQACVFNHGELHEKVFPAKPVGTKGSRFPKGFNASEPFITKVGNLEVLAWSLRSVEKPKNEKRIEDHWCIIESFRISDWGGDILAVQWHPEELKTYELLNNFMNSDSTETAPMVLSKHV